MILLDTNLLTRLTSSLHPHCRIAREAAHRLRARKLQLVIVPQNLYEFWAVATRKPGMPPSGQNGLGMTSDQASLWISYFLRQFTLLTDEPSLVDEWHDLVKSHGITGLRSHDARLAAAMKTYGIGEILTFNGSDFQGFGVSVIHPNSV